MTSTNKPPTWEPARALLDWRGAGLRYFAYSHYLRARFGGRVQKVSVDARFTCPNIDGTVGLGGCNFCDNRSFSPSRRLPPLDLTAQIDVGIRRLKRRYDCDRFIAYFQPATNTYAPVETLRQLYETALKHPKVVGLAVATRPDCAADDVLDLLAELAARHYVSVQFGVQTMHDRTLDWIGRGHHHDASIDAVTRARRRGIETCAQIILGLPGESHEDMLLTARELARLDVDAVKIHNLYAVHNTRLAKQVARGEVHLMPRDEYVRVLVDFLEVLPPTTLIERVSGNAPREYLVGPAWCLDTPAVLRAVEEEFCRRNTWQGEKG